MTRPPRILQVHEGPAPSGIAIPHSHDHDHPHSHDHDHDHDHPHPHPHDHHHSAPSPLPRAGSPRPLDPSTPRPLLHLDAPSGLAGDMICAALLDLGVPLAEVEAAVATLPLSGVELRLSDGYAGAIGARKFDVLVHGNQPERSYGEIDGMLAGAALPPGARELARAIFLRLAQAEAEVHRVPLADVHFHEVGAVDAIVDIVGAAVCFDFLQCEVSASPLPLGRGYVTCRHGVIPLPAPAALLCLRGVPTYDAGIAAELVTPTGAAIVATVAKSFVAWPNIVPERIGWGMGSQALEDRPNALRAVFGQGTGNREPVATHVVLETNIDDMSGELAAHALAKLFEAGALDAWITPIVMKKGRPAITLAALCTSAHADEIGAVLLRETSTLGYRRSPVSRGERPRRNLDVETPFGTVPVKISEGPWGAPQLKPEFDVCAERAREHGVPVREVIQAALVAARSLAGA